LDIERDSKDSNREDPEKKGCGLDACEGYAQGEDMIVQFSRYQ
jgi:hypothetical protein